MRTWRTSFALALISSGLSCSSVQPASTDVSILRTYCEDAVYLKTDLAVEWQLDTVPQQVIEALERLDSQKTQAHHKYLAYLMLRERERQADQFGADYALPPAVPDMVRDRVRTLLLEHGCRISSDATSAEYAQAILAIKDLFKGYATAKQLALSLQKRLGLPVRRR